MQFYTSLEIRTAKEALFHPNRSLAKFQAENGDMALNAFLTHVLTDLVMFFNVGKTMNEAQIVELVRLIKVDYYFLRPSEIRYCFDNAKKGKYGALYDRIDGSIIIEWIEKYLEERLYVVMEERDRKHDEVKNETISFDPKVAEVIIKALNRKPAEVKPEINTSTLKKELSPLDLKLQGFFKEFDSIYRDKPIGEMGGKRFIDYKGKILDQEEYAKIRLSEV